MTLLTPAFAFADDAPVAKPAADSGVLGEVVVTSRRRAENVKDVPVAVTAVTAASLEKLDIRNTVNLMQYTPGLQYSDFAVGNFNARLALRPVIFRGLSLLNDYGVTAASLIFLDGGPLLGGEVPAGVDIERVEVLRGPQSVYFGRSTMSGAVNYVTKGIADHWGGQLAATGAQYGTVNLSGAIGGPVIADKLKVGLQVSSEKHSGYYTDTADRSYQLGAQSTQSISAEFELTPTENLKIRGFTNYFTNKDGVGATTQLSQPQNNCSLGGTRTWYCGTLPGYKTLGLYSIVAISPADANFLAHPKYLSSQFDADGLGLQRRAQVSNLKVDWTIPGIATVTALSSYENDSSQGAQNGMFQAPYVGALYYNQMYSYNFDAHNFDQELRISSLPYANLPLRWTLGGNYLQGSLGREADLCSIQYTKVGASTLAPESCVNSGFGTNKAHTYGVFAGAYYDFTSKLSLSLEGRYQEDNVEAVPLLSSYTLKQKFPSFSPRVALNYKVSPDLTAYVSYAKGSRPGGFNTSVLPYAPGGSLYATHQTTLAEFIALVGPISSTFKEEDLTTYEVGLKGTYFNRLRLNATGYYGYVENLQVGVTAVPASLPNSLTATSNAGKVDIWGVEADGSLYLTRMLSFSGTFAWNHTNIVQYLCTSCVPWTGSSNVNGNQLPDAPEFSGSLGADLHDNLPMFSGWEWYGHTDYVYRGTQFIAVFNQGGKVPARNVINLRAGVQNQTTTFEAFATNVTNDTNYTTIGTGFDQATTGYTKFQGSLPPPRIIGARVGYKF